MMGRTLPSWRVVVDQKIAELSRFKQFLGGEDRAVFDDLLTQCKLYPAEAGALASPVSTTDFFWVPLSSSKPAHEMAPDLEKTEKAIRKDSALFASIIGLPTTKTQVGD
jgi:hypothetical protein